MNDLKFALRQLLKSPGFTAVAVLTLALGIGANTAIFGVINELLLRPLPVKNPEGLLGIVLTGPGGDFADQSIPYPIVEDYRELSGQVFEEFAAYAATFAPVEIGGAAQFAFLQLATSSYFSTLGVPPEMGRFFDAKDDSLANQGAVAVLSHAAWQSWLGGDPDAIGKTITLRPFYVDPVLCTVIGVAPAGFNGLEQTTPQLWLPAVMEKQFKDAAQINFRMIGRLPDGVRRSQAEPALDPVAASVAAKHGGRPIPGYGNEGIFRSDLRTELRHAALGSWGAFRSHGPVRRARLLAFGVAGLVLLIACANIANLLLARAERRRKETAIRISLGASRERVLRSALIEAWMLSLLGGCAGILFAYGGNRLLMALKPPDVELLVRTQLDLRVAGFCLVVAMITGLLVGLLPAWRGSRENPNLALKGQTGSMSPGGLNWRDGFAAVQIALSLILLIGTGLCLRSFAALTTSNPGFNADKLLVARLDFQNTPESNGQVHYRSLVERLTAIPGVESASWTRALPILPRGGGSSVAVDRIEGYVKERDEFLNVKFADVGPGYFQTMGMPVAVPPSRPLAGTGSLVWVNEAFVQRYWPGSNPIGRQVGDWIVEGVVKNARIENLWDPPPPYLYRQQAEPDARAGIFLIRTAGDPDKVLNQVRSILMTMDSDLDVSGITTMRAALSQTLGAQKFMVALLGLFAGCALLLAVIGIYGVVSYLVIQRVREIGIRMALGASGKRILLSILRRSGITTACGVLAGLLGSWAATRLLGTVLFGISPTDVSTFAFVSFVLTGSAMLASFLPARQAAKTDPMVALRNE
ncbi:MAG: ABC transporter permease [Planctomycetales bacterium]|nr:ABC transporter permease [Planctomycetales bacterium]